MTVILCLLFLSYVSMIYIDDKYKKTKDLNSDKCANKNQYSNLYTGILSDFEASFPKKMIVVLTSPHDN